MSKYEALRQHLQSLPATTLSVTLSFGEIEGILAFPLPPSARTYSAWWANEAAPHSRHTHAVWVKAGWETRKVDIHSKRVTFMRVGSAHRAGEPSNPAPVPIVSAPQLTTGGPPRRIGLISCTKKKLTKPARARDLYSASDLFKKAAAYCEAHLDGWYVLSAKYGLVEPGRVLAPYDVTLKTMTRSERRRWGVQVAQQLRQLGDVALEAHAGADYVQPLLDAGVVLGNPLQGLRYGERLAWYGARL